MSPEAFSVTSLPRAERSTLARTAIRQIVKSYSKLVIRVYSTIRFTILRQPFLEEIGQYLPRQGRILDLGCGFGLFSLYFAMLERGRSLTGVDMNARRIEYAQASARKLGLDNIEYEVADAIAWVGQRQFDAIFFLDLVHHLPVAEVPDFLDKVSRLLQPDGVLVIKDVAHRPFYKMLFTLILDRLMVGMEPIRYWPPDELEELLEDLGFEVIHHRLNDILPYPHILFVARRAVHRTETSALPSEAAAH